MAHEVGHIKVVSGTDFRYPWTSLYFQV